MSVHYTRLVVPSFDLAWFEFKSLQYLLSPGGGGSAKSGVQNQIQILPISLDVGSITVNSYLSDADLSSKLCSGTCCGVINVFNRIIYQYLF